MKIKLILIGKTDSKYLNEGNAEYQKRLKHYIPTDIIVIPDIKNSKNLSELEQKKKEGDLILNQIKEGDLVILLDENGKQFSSVEFSRFIEKQTISGLKNLVFVVGGPYGFSDEVYKKASSNISLSRMTFSHQMVRLIFLEQLYRAMTIIKGEPYHHN
ncbi:MAG: 23S rRNA (pseudouridine(1915)-N(3))-methyltransferase RlmH [Bacteroidales bacterium]|jgi:23S rRNA (pseudouridine1915-N3)-methyltransferase|nr:23S rRNA (pseudouridine(1915)-N(3))-methyltransferase RlmH [Bacteroidales bacterium]